MSTAYVLINCDLGSEEFVISELKSTEGVIEVHGTFEAYDILAKVQAELVEKLKGDPQTQVTLILLLKRGN